MNFTIVVNDNGELKTVTAAELDKWPKLAAKLQETLNFILDKRVIPETEVRSDG